MVIQANYKKTVQKIVLKIELKAHQNEIFVVEKVDLKNVILVNLFNLIIEKEVVQN